MFEDNKVNNLGETSGNLDFNNSPNKFKPFIIIAAIIIFLVLAVIIIVSLVNRQDKSKPVEKKEDVKEEIIENGEENGEFVGLIDYSSLQPLSDDQDLKVDPVKDEAIENLNYIDFYQAPELISNLNFLEYSLPIEVKTEVVNYFEFNRRLNLDRYLDDLSKDGAVIINNPWSNNAKDFYSAYLTISSNGLPLFISSDFILYHYNLMLKDVFSQIESSFFYDSLWEINSTLYQNARTRYESYLNEVGNINDPILEAKRLVVAYFAVSLSLLSPEDNQISSADRVDETKFTLNEAYRYRFDMPSYLNNDVLPEINLIRSAKEERRSPVLTYNRDYKDFSVPSSYRGNAKQMNFWLASQWLNSLFPLNYKDDYCLDCLLDINDWRINFLASLYISQDIANDSFLKAEWARIYKIMSWSEGLEDIITYLYYRDDYYDLFADKSIEEVFSAENEEAHTNMESLRARLLAHQFNEIQGGIDYSIAENRKKAGFQLLAKRFWPLEYVYNSLTEPNVVDYLNTEVKDNNVTACRKDSRALRCNPFALDSLSLLNLNINSAYYLENTNYYGYSTALNNLKQFTNPALESRHNAYFSNLSSLQKYLEPNDVVPIYAKSQAWNDRLKNTAAAAIVDWQLNADSFSRTTSRANQVGLGVGDSEITPVYIEPAINLINDLLANIQMLSKMLSALGADIKARQAMINLDYLYNDLDKISQLSIESIENQNLEFNNQRLLLNWLKTYEINSLANKTLNPKSSLRQDLSGLKFLLVILPTEKGPMLAISPIWDLKESN